MQHLLDPRSYLPVDLVGPASAAIDQSIHLRKLLVDVFKDYLKKRNTLKKDRKFLVDEYIKDANLEELAFNPVDLAARGFTPDEVEMLKQWRRANDILYWMSNLDLVKTLRARGYKIFTDTNGTHLVAKEVKRKAVNRNTTFYNSKTDSFENMSAKELDEFYDNGGTLVKTAEPVKIKGEFVEYVKADNTPEGGYLRALKREEVVLPYRNGYYPTMYNANFFVDKLITTKNGDKVTKTVATARTTKEAARLTEKLNSSAKKGETFEARPDKFQTPNPEYPDMTESSWNIAVSSSMSAQRVRGERLLDAEVDLHKAGHTNLVDPLEAVSYQVSALSQRVKMRDYLEGVKKRWMDQYFEALNLKKDKFGHRHFPTNANQIKGAPGISDEVVQDAKSIFNYIHHLENGYANIVDKGFKAGFNRLADLLAKYNKPALEGWTRDMAKNTSPTGALRGAAFQLYLAANPFRQLLIQGHQIIQLNAIMPAYTSGGGLGRDMFRLRRASFGYTKDKEAVEMLNEFNRSGFLEAVDANNLVRQEALRLADASIARRVLDVAKAPLRVSQKVGFDVAEQTVLETAWLAMRHKKIKAKGTSKLTRRDYDEIAGDARAFTFDMNKAGDMPYNQNSLSVITQFLQVPHKALLQPFFNRNLSRYERLRLFTWNTVMYGVPTGILPAWYYANMPEGPLRDSIEYGLEDVLFNAVATNITGEKQSVDWGDLSPVNAYGVYETIHGIFTTDALGIIANTPSGSLLFGGNPRITEAFKTAARWIVPAWNYEDPELAVKYTDVAVAFGNLFSGVSNTFKMVYALESRKMVSSVGNITDEDVTKWEAMMKMFGMRTHLESGTQEVMNKIYKGQQRAFTKSDVSIWYNELKRMLNRRGIDNMERQELEMMQRIMSEGYRVWQMDERYFQEQFERLIQEDIKKNGTNIYEQIAKMIKMKNNDEVRKLLNMLPDSEQRQMINDWITQVEEDRERIRELEKEFPYDG